MTAKPPKVETDCKLYPHHE